MLATSVLSLLTVMCVSAVNVQALESALPASVARSRHLPPCSLQTGSGSSPFGLNVILRDPLRLRGGGWGMKKKKKEEKVGFKEWIGVGLQVFLPSLFKKVTGFVILWTLMRMEQTSSNGKPSDNLQEWPEDAVNKSLRRPNFSFTKSTDFPDISTTPEEEAAEQRAKQNDEESLRMVSERNAAIVKELHPGDHIKVAGAFGFRSMAHHAIYIGKNEVVHFTGGASSDTSLDAKMRAKITREGVAKVSDLANEGRCVLQVVPMPADAFPRDQIVARALSRVGDAGYNLVLSNCEHFAQWCVTGLKRSDQVLLAIGAPLRFLQQAVEDLVTAAEHPIRGKTLRKAGNTVRAVLGVVGLHLAFVAW